MLEREIRKSILADFKRKKVIVLLGARQVGKKKSFVVTGSSSFDMANEINESATGRLIEYNLYPFSLAELAADTSEREEK